MPQEPNTPQEASVRRLEEALQQPLGGPRKLEGLPARAPPPKTLDPLLSRLTLATVRATFEGEVGRCVKALTAFGDAAAAAAVGGNAAKLVAISALTACLDKFTPYLEPDYLALRLVELGELLLGLPAFIEVASSHCFHRYLVSAAASSAGRVPGQGDVNNALDAAPIHPPSRLQQACALRSRIGMALATLQGIQRRDPRLLARPSVAGVLGVLDVVQGAMEACAQAGEELSWLLYNCSFHVYQITGYLAQCAYTTEVGGWYWDWGWCWG
jgi:hypothetical protein